MIPNLECTEFSVPIPGIHSIGKVSITRATEPFHEEMHEDLYELLLLTTGRRTWIVNGDAIRMQGGDLTLIKPDQRHHDPAPRQSRSTQYYLLFHDPLEFEDFCYLNEEMRLYLGRCLRDKGFNDVINGSEALTASFLHLYKFSTSLEDRAPDCMCGEDGQKQFTLHYLLMDLFHQLLTSLFAPVRSLSPDIALAVDWITQHRNEFPSVSQLARIIHLSESHFKQKFKNEMGLPPGEYINRNKTDHAQSLLRTSSLSIKEIAEQLGFTSSRHFSDTFKKCCGQSPSDYRRNSVRPH